MIPTYNRAELLRSAIRSVLNQTFQDFEIVVIDDASKDNTKEIVSSFNDKRMKYIRHEVNKGEAGARNTGVTSSSGQYIAFIDDDDEWLPEKLQMQVDLIESSSPSVGVVYTGAFILNKISGRMKDQIIPAKRGYILNELLLRNFLILSTVLIKKECFEKVGLFDKNIISGPDYDMWIRISRKYHFEYIKEPLVKYYLHENRLSNQLEKTIVGLESIIRKHSQLFASNHNGYRHHYLTLGVLYCLTGNTKKGREALLKAIKLYPFEIRYYFNFGLSLLGANAFKNFKKAKEKAFAPFRTTILSIRLRSYKSL